MEKLISKYQVINFFLCYIFNFFIYFHRPSTAQIKEDLPAEYLNSSLAQQQQVYYHIKKLNLRNIHI